MAQGHGTHATCDRKINVRRLRYRFACQCNVDHTTLISALSFYYFLRVTVWTVASCAFCVGCACALVIGAAIIVRSLSIDETCLAFSFSTFNWLTAVHLLLYHGPHKDKARVWLILS